jgi:hypothetical protein
VLEVSLLGEQYVAGSTATNLARSSRSIALLAFLALHADAPQPRQRLAATFWPDSTEQQARTNLRRELHHLRVLLGDEPSLVVEPATLMWRESPTCRVDVCVFHRERQLALQAVAAGGPALDAPAWCSGSRGLPRRSAAGDVGRLGASRAGAAASSVHRTLRPPGGRLARRRRP